MTPQPLSHQSGISHAEVEDSSDNGEADDSNADSESAGDGEAEDFDGNWDADGACADEADGASWTEGPWTTWRSASRSFYRMSAASAAGAPAEPAYASEASSEVRRRYTSAITDVVADSACTASSQEDAASERRQSKLSALSCFSQDRASRSGVARPSVFSNLSSAWSERASTTSRLSHFTEAWRRTMMFRLLSSSGSVSDIGETDSSPWCGVRRTQLGKFLESRPCSVASCGVIVVNCIFISVEQAQNFEQDMAFKVSRLSFLCFYTMELILHVLAFGISVLWDNGWITLDAFILIAELSSGVGGLLFTGWFRTGDSLLLIRLMRLAPLVRAFPLLVRFQVLKVLVRALLSSAGILCSTMFVLTVFLYIFGVLGMELVGMHPNAMDAEADSEFSEIASMYFATIPRTMLTLVQFVCLDTIAAIYRPLVTRDSLLVLYFVPVVLAIPVLLMNLITGVIVSSTQEHTLQDKAEAGKQAKKKLARELQGIFRRLDEDRSGQVTKEEIMSISERDRERLNSVTNLSNPLTIFEALDPEETGTLCLEEFCDGVWQLAMSKCNIEVQQMEKQVARIHRRLEGYVSHQEKMRKSLRRVLILQQGLHNTLCV